MEKELVTILILILIIALAAAIVYKLFPAVIKLLQQPQPQPIGLPQLPNKAQQAAERQDYRQTIEKSRSDYKALMDKRTLAP